MATLRRRDQASRLSLNIVGLDAVGPDGIRAALWLIGIGGIVLIALALIVGYFGGAYAGILSGLVAVGGGKAVARRLGRGKRTNGDSVVPTAGVPPKRSP